LTALLTSSSFFEDDLDRARLKRPTKHIIGHIGDSFCESNNPTNSVKALKEERF